MVQVRLGVPAAPAARVGEENVHAVTARILEDHVRLKIVAIPSPATSRNSFFWFIFHIFLQQDSDGAASRRRARNLF